MAKQEARGINLSTGEAVVVEFATAIDSVEPDWSGGAGRYVAPGFIDLQVNGFAGVDYNSPVTPHDEIERSLGAIFATGVTRFYPTVITGSPEDMSGALKNLAQAKAKVKHGTAMEGFHVEGPYISAEDGPRGAHPRHCVRPPSPSSSSPARVSTHRRSVAMLAVARPGRPTSSARSRIAIIWLARSSCGGRRARTPASVWISSR